MAPFSSSQQKANGFILCGLTIKKPQNHFLSVISYLISRYAKQLLLGKLKLTLCQQSQKLKNPAFFCLFNLIVFAFDWHYHWWKTESFHMPGASCWPIIANIVLESRVKCQLPTQCLSEINVPLRKRHRQFHNPSTLQSCSPCFFLGDPFILMLLLYTYRMCVFFRRSCLFASKGLNNDRFLH